LLSNLNLIQSSTTKISFRFSSKCFQTSLTATKQQGREMDIASPKEESRRTFYSGGKDVRPNSREPVTADPDASFSASFR